MNGIMPGPLWLAIASAGKSDSLENVTLTHRSESDTVAAKKSGSHEEPMNDFANRRARENGGGDEERDRRTPRA
jgi:hypothetical protein